MTRLLAESNGTAIYIVGYVSSEVTLTDIVNSQALSPDGIESGAEKRTRNKSKTVPISTKLIISFIIVDCVVIFFISNSILIDKVDNNPFMELNTYHNE